MECNKDEAIRAKDIAETKIKNNDFQGARKFVLKAKKLHPELANISQLLAVCDVHCSSDRKINGTEMDLYGILQVDSLANEATIKKQYRKLAILLHPDKNKFVGAESAFKLIGEAYMILSDVRKRYLHDLKCRGPLKQTLQPESNGGPSFTTATQPPHPGHWEPASSQPDHVGKPTFSKPQPESNGDKDVRHSTQPPHPGSKQNVDPSRPASSQPDHVGKYATNGDAKVSGSSLGNTTKGEKEGITSKETGGNHTVASDSNCKDAESRKRPRKRSQVSDSEGAVNDFIPPKKSRQRKSSSSAERKQKNKVCGTAELNKDYGEGSIPRDKIKEKDKLKENVKSDSHFEDDSEPVCFDVKDLEFSNFDQDKEEHCFATDQIWAVYDTVDSMPRFYAYIDKVYTSEFKLGITWLEADPQNKLEKKWVKVGLPVACGRYKCGDSEETKDRLMFSHKITYEKVSKIFPFFVYPKKGEIWALFRDWDIKWSVDSENHMNNKIEIVEILSDYDKENGSVAAFMVKVEGFVSLFRKTSRARLTEHRIPSSELFRFSHCIPSVKLSGNERADVPVGSYELDTASIPDNLDDYIFSSNLKATPENVSEQTSHQSPQTKMKKNVFDKKETPNVITRRSPRGLKGNNMDGVENMSSDVFNGVTKRPQPSSSSSVSGSGSGKDAIIVHDFNLDKKAWEFEKGQIWALNLKCFAQIKKIETSPERLHVDILELCCNVTRPNVCGLYRPSKDGRRVFQRDSFLYNVKAVVNGKNRFNIYPREKEIWILYKKQESKCTFSDVKAGDCEFVEVVENNGDNITVFSLSRVGGYKSVFRAHGRDVQITINESDRFFNRVPAFHLTEQQDVQLRGCWELDLAEFPGPLQLL